MKVAIANNDNMCTEHFGHCEGFKIYEIRDYKIINEYFIKNPGHKPGFLPMFLKEKGVNVVISGGMGQRAQEIFNENNIQIIVGISGDNNTIINQFIQNTIKSDNSICNKHKFKDSCFS